MKRAFARAAVPVALAAALLLAGCTGSSKEKAPEPLGTRAATAVLEDGLILAAIKARLTAQYPDSATSVSVAVTDGVVALRGTVRDAATRKHMVEDSRETVHVERVVDELRVDRHQRRISERVGDVALAARVETAIIAESGVQKVGVRVDRGVATLDGTVDDAKTKDALLAAARDTAGIRNVVDRIRVGTP